MPSSTSLIPSRCPASTVETLTLLRCMQIGPHAVTSTSRSWRGYSTGGKPLSGTFCNLCLGTLRTPSHLNLDPRRRMVAGLLPPSRAAVDAGGFQFLRERWAQQRMVDADASVALERITPVRP